MATQPQPARGAAPLPRQAPGAETPPPEPAGGEPTPGSKPPPDPEQAPPQATPPHAAQPLPRHSIKRTRTSGVWVAVGFFAVILLLLLIFIVQNSTEVSVSYLGMHGRLPLGVAMLLSAVCGVLLVVLAGAARISQLRAVARRHRRADARSARRAAVAPKEPAGPVR